MDESRPANWAGIAIEIAIEDALRSAPLEPAPPDLYQAVMQQIHAQTQPVQAIQAGNPPAQPAPFEKLRFRVTWLDGPARLVVDIYTGTPLS